MDQRIKEFAAQAKEFAFQTAKSSDVKTWSDEWFNAYHEKFAELIVKECISIIRMNDDETFSEADGRARTILREVKKHFGVEE